MLLLICTDESLMSMMCANENRERYSFPIIFGGRNRDRTCDIQLVRLALSQLSYSPLYLAGSTGLEPAASGVTGRRYNRLNYDPAKKFPSKTTRTFFYLMHADFEIVYLSRKPMLFYGAASRRIYISKGLSRCQVNFVVKT
jgi:hypothetical protein